MTALRDAITSLREATSTPLERNDLGRLAQMHSCCQNLGEASSADNGDAAQAIESIAAGLAALLERVILDEVAEPDAALAAVPGITALLEQACEGKPVDATAATSRMQAAIDGSAEQPAASGTPEPAAPTTPSPVKEAPAATPPEQRPSAAKIEPYLSEPLTIDLSEREHLDGFLDEAAEHMDNIEGGLLEVESAPTNTDKVNELFRPFHTIKGIAGFLNLRDINRLTHEIETILDLGRKSELQITTAIIDLVFSGVDALKAQLDAIREYLAEPSGTVCPQPDITEIMAQLRCAMQSGPAAQQENPGSQEKQAAQDQPPKQTLGDILVAQGIASENQIEHALSLQSTDSGPPRKLGEILIQQGATTQKELDRALSRQSTGKHVRDQSIRVDTQKLDALVDAVGELVIAQSMVVLAEAERGNAKLSRNVAQVTKIVRDVQETAMAMRMVPIGHTFQKMRRLVRDVSRKAGKNVELTINGEETELDKNVIQEISDPLVHMVRNAVDHGVEPAEERRASGKPEDGQVTLNAYHQGDSIVIEIRDDGRGLDRDKLIAKATERGLIAPGEQLTDAQAYALTLQPGFSTAERITDISGRGVGMDVVKRNVEQLRGKIEIESEKGRGSCFAIRLPLTLAIIDGMLVRIGDDRLIIPTILIEQSLRPEARQITTVQRRGAMLQVRGELCPLIQLGAVFGCTEAVDPCENLVVIVQCEGQKIALVVEELIGQQQVVIKTLGERFKSLEGVSGAAVLGDGRVGLILEPTGLVALHNRLGSSLYIPRVPAVDPATSPPATPESESGQDTADPASPSEAIAESEEPVMAPV